jgi:hypothetical protein
MTTKRSARLFVLALALAGATTAFAGNQPSAPPQAAIELHDWSAASLYELGNAYATSGRTGPAILSFERARLIAPRDPAIRASLERTREAAGIAGPAQSRANAALARLSSDEWTHIAMLAAVLACVGVIGFAWSRERRVMRTAVIAGALVSAFAITAAVRVAPSENAAVVVHGDTARIAPTLSADAAFTAPEGEDVRIEQRRGDFVYVRDGDRSGWIPSSAVERVLTEQPHAAHA